MPPVSSASSAPALPALALAVLLAIPALAAATPATADRAADRRDAARDRDMVAADILEGLTTEVGPRLAATAAEARARDYGVAKLKALGFHNVHVEPYDMPVWQRGEESAEVVAPFPQKLAVAALGNSGPTPAGGVTAPIVAFDGLDALVAAPAAAIRGRIVFVTHHMAPQQDGGSYGALGPIRFAGPAIAAGKGALAIVIKSVGTDHHRMPHTGVTNWPAGIAPIPAAALSTVDADQLSRIVARGRPVTLHLAIGAHMAGTGPSGNVVAEVPGRDPKAGVILIGGHLDSWDLGTGAIDDAAGVAITTAAAKRLLDGPKPLHTIRLVWFGAEEPGGYGGQAYAKAHAAEPHMFVAESDFGADRVWRFAVRLPDPRQPLVDTLAAALAPLGITRDHGPAHGGTDVGPTAAAGWPVIDLGQDGTRYFDLHHTADDTLDKIDPVQLRQNVAAWTALLDVTANDPGEFGKLPPRADGEE